MKLAAAHVVLALTAGITCAADWPGWRGATGDGQSTEQGIPIRWSTVDEMGKPAPQTQWINVRWRVLPVGSGHSSPIVVGQRVYLTAALDDKATRAILCFDADTGKELWQAECPSTKKEKLGGDGKKAGYAAPTPVCDGERIFAYFGAAGVFCVDRDGKPVWHVVLPGIDHVWGSGASPILVGELLIVNGDTEGVSHLFAFNKKTGKEVWKAKRDGGGGWSSPLIIPHDGREELIVCGKQRVTAYDPTSGNELWHCTGLTDTVCPTPVYGQGMLFAVSGRNGPVLAIRPGGKQDVTKTHVAWDEMRGGPSVPSPVLVGNHLYVVNDGGLITCSEAKTGKRLYQDRLDGSFSASPAAADGKLYFVNEEGTTHIVTAGAEFKLAASNRLAEPCYASPALANGRIFIRTTKSLVCIEEKR